MIQIWCYCSGLATPVSINIDSPYSYIAGAVVFMAAAFAYMGRCVAFCGGLWSAMLVCMDADAFGRCGASCGVMIVIERYLEAP